MKGRNYGVDAVKGLLVALMAMGHLCQVVLPDFRPGWKVSFVANLLCFPGFLLCFGYAASNAYLSRTDEEARPRIWRNAGRLTAAYVASAALVTGLSRPCWTEVVAVLELRRLAHFSEFFLSFALLMVAFGVALPVWRRVGRGGWWAVLGALALGIASTQLRRYALPGGALGDVWPVDEGFGFPVLCYGFYFVAGLVAARDPVPWTAYALAGVLSVAAWVHGFPGRFPPSPWWLAASALPVLGLFGLASRVTCRPNSVLVRMGAHTLPLVVGSNGLFHLVRFLRHG